MARLNVSGTGGQAELPTRELVAGSTYWCVFPAKFAAVSFNPNTYGDPELGTVGGRFHPFESPPGTRIPTKYLADHENGALAETLLRDAPGERDVPLAEITSRRIARLRLQRSLQVVDLTELSSDSSLDQLLRQGHKAYPPLRSFVATLHACRPSIEGLLWEGYQLSQPGMKCLMLFGDRVFGDTDFGEIEVQELDSGTGLRALRAASRLRRFTLPKSLSLDGVSTVLGAGRGPIKSGTPSRVQPESADVLRSRTRPVAIRDAANDQHIYPATAKQAEDLLAQLAAEEYCGFVLHYQPQIRVPGRLIVGFEALLRWRSSDGDLVGASDLIPLVERAGRSHAINEWVLQTACREAASWPETLSVAVNVSSAQFRNERFVESVSKVLEQSALAPTRLEVEIAGHSLIEDVNFTLERLKAIREMDVSVAVSEFGVGYSSPYLLGRLSISKIKIDRVFMNGELAERSLAIVDALIALGVGLGVETVVEGVETVEQLTHLEAGQPCIAQGYLISRPVSTSTVVEFLNNNPDED